MNWIRQWCTSLAYKQTLHRLDFILDYMDMHGVRPSLKEKMEFELENLSKLLHGSPERKETHREYEEKMERELDRNQKEKDSI